MLTLRVVPVAVALSAVLCVCAAAQQQTPNDLSGSLSVAAPSSLAGYNPDQDPEVEQQTFTLANNAFASLSGSWTQERSGSNWSASASHLAAAEVFGGLRPMASAEVSMGVQSSSPFITLGNGVAASAQLNYEVVIASRRTAPGAYVPPIPLYVDVAAEASFTGSTSARGARARVMVANTAQSGFNRVLNAVADENDEIQSLSESWAFTARPGDRIIVNLAAFAETQAVNPDVMNPEATALADPLFRFDQESFDQAMNDAGYPTFDLEEYFAFTYSPGLIPEPTTASLLGGLLMLAGVSRRSRR